jgi:hypothetical protein
MKSRGRRSCRTTRTSSDPVGTLNDVPFARRHGRADLHELGVDRAGSELAHAPVGFDATNPAAYPAAHWAPIRRGRPGRRRARDRRLLRAHRPRPAVGDHPRARRASPRTTPTSTSRPRPSSATSSRPWARATTAATRPSGSSSPLPKVKFWGVWDEPNYGYQLRRRRSTASRSRRSSTAGCSTSLVGAASPPATAATRS